MTEIFRTNVQSAADAQVLVAALRAALGCQPSFDLEDCDRVLRVAGLGSGQAVTQVMDIVARHGFTASVLPG